MVSFVSLVSRRAYIPVKSTFQRDTIAGHVFNGTQAKTSRHKIVSGLQPALLKALSAHGTQGTRGTPFWAANTQEKRGGIVKIVTRLSVVGFHVEMVATNGIAITPAERLTDLQRQWETVNREIMLIELRSLPRGNFNVWGYSDQAVRFSPEIQ